MNPLLLLLEAKNRVIKMITTQIEASENDNRWSIIEQKGLIEEFS